MPGIMGSDMTLQKWSSIITNALKSKRINAIFWVCSAIERPNMLDLVLSQGMDFLLDKFSENNVILVLTKCDLWRPDSKCP